MKLLIVRDGSMSSMGTFGEIALGHDVIHTLERPWLDNQRGVSCVPAGLYSLERHHSGRFGEVFALVNESLGVYHYPNPKAKRDLILLHPANVVTELEGCIAPGMSLGCVDGKWAVISSKQAMARLFAFIGDTPKPQVEIVWRHYPSHEDGPSDA